MKNSKDTGRPSASFIAGSVALLFLIIGYQAALFIHKAAVAKVVADHDSPDTVYVFPRSLSGVEGLTSVEGPTSVEGNGGSTFSPTASRGSLSPVEGPDNARAASTGSATGNPRPSSVRKPSRHSPAAESICRANTPRRYESFRFNPNTASIDDLMRLGFSQRQAESIDNYRKKGGRFRRKADFARSYVVEDSVYQRLEPYIDIPKIDINKADSAALTALPGIGKFFASKIVSYRKELGGYSYPEQLMDLWHFDEEKFEGLKDLITVGPCEAFPLWTLPEAELAKHPYIGRRAAHGIVLFRDNSPRSDWAAENLKKAGILTPEAAGKLSRCRIAPPSSE